MMSANNLKQIEGADIVSMINEDFIWFYDRNNGSVEVACSLIQHITQYWSSRFDCVLERWLLRHPEDLQKIAFTQVSGESYTWEQILSELRLQTEVGRLFEQMINEFYIYQLNNKKMNDILIAYNSRPDDDAHNFFRVVPMKFVKHVQI